VGSGFADYFLNGILQKSLTKKTTLRLNGGILFAGTPRRETSVFAALAKRLLAAPHSLSKSQRGSTLARK